MNEANPYEPPRSPQALPKGRNPAWWIVAWLGLGILFCALFVPGSDPFTSLCVMGFGAASFGLGGLFARAKRGGDPIDG